MRMPFYKALVKCIEEGWTMGSEVCERRWDGRGMEFLGNKGVYALNSHSYAEEVECNPTAATQEPEAVAKAETPEPEQERMVYWHEAGRLAMEQGYEVLIFVENSGHWCAWDKDRVCFVDTKDSDTELWVMNTSVTYSVRPPRPKGKRLAELTEGTWFAVTTGGTDPWCSVVVKDQHGGAMLPSRLYREQLEDACWYPSSMEAVEEYRRSNHE